MKKRALFLILLLILSLLPACDCVTGLEDLIPALDSYAEWDGNYMYRGNVRVKTTGEDVEFLLPEITYENKTYTIGEANTRDNYRFFGDNTLILFNSSFAVRLVFAVIS